ncbi:polygalacturonase-like [Gastrolobium bilobum]|uniref:polygalacturonase-like n=1 Tax=Gastrolobium bilobum TaxID=150636 RepID=UPI002AB23436|nr:polygalacturonase-like [Gastrolobium bilobum]
MANPTTKPSPLSLLVLHTLYFLSYSLFLHSTLAKSTTFNVVDFGANPDGQTDSTEAFLSVWNKACDSAKPVGIYVPQGQFLLSKVTFTGQCNNNAISITIDGTLVAPSDYNVIGNAGYWLNFNQVSGVSIHGGVLDGQGTYLWDCKNLGQTCPLGATTLGFSNSDNIVITGLTSLNSQMFHVVFNGCHTVKVHGLTVKAAGNSPNTDGIHVQFSSDVTILKPRIRTGDDCISVGPGTKNLWIEDVACGPGHGISIGSLGWDLREPGVKNVTVKTATFSKTQNGFRIKSWGRASNGFVKDVHFEHAIMTDVQNPIVIDQNYCPYYKDCPSQASGVKVSDVSYKDIHGTSATKVAVKFDCSSKHPCKRIRLEDVKLTYKSQTPQALCKHAAGTAFGVVQPESCF